MKPASDKRRYQRILRWMITNLEVASSVYHTPQGQLRLDPALTIGHDRIAARYEDSVLPDFGDWELTSAVALVACCYIESLGKVVTRHTKAKPIPHPQRFRAFIDTHMPDLAKECTEKGRGHSIQVLHKRYRNGFVHQFADQDAHWGRDGRHRPYWYVRSNEPALNVDRFVAGVVTGIRDFQEKWPLDPHNGPDPYANFSAWLLGA